MRKCRDCKKTKPISDFYIDRKKVIRPNCKECVKQRSKEHRLQNPEMRKKTALRYYRHLRMKALQAYGGAKPFCACCGLNQIEFLTIDHIDGGGNKQRQKMKLRSFYSWLKKNNYPKGFQILCMNCNFAKGMYDICPHKSKNLSTWESSLKTPRNSKRMTMLTFNGHTMCITDWAKQLGINRSVLSARINRNHWAVDKTLSTPI